MGIVEQHAFLPPRMASYDQEEFQTLTYPLHEFGKEQPASVEIPYLMLLAGSGKAPALMRQTPILNKTTILYFHGNACDIGSLQKYGREICKSCNANFVAVEYPGYGQARNLHSSDERRETEITPSEKWVYFATEAILDELAKVWGIKSQDIILMGKSIGSGPAVEFASRQPFKGLIIDSGFTSCVRIKVTLPRVLQWMSDNLLDIFVNTKKLPDVKCKVMLIHSKGDDVVPFEHSEENWNQIPDKFKSKRVIYDYPEHNAVEFLHDGLGRNVGKFNPEYFAEIQNFVMGN